MATSWSGGVNFEVGAKAFAEKINYLSDGKINIQAFPGGTLGKAFKVSGTVKNGVEDYQLYTTLVMVIEHIQLIFY